MNYSSMSPTIVQKNGKTVLVIGSPGSARIISSVAQLTQMWIDSGMSITEIVSQPRLHSINGKVYFEDETISENWVTPFIANGFEIGNTSSELMIDGQNAYFGGIHAIAFEKGKWVGAADPRRDGIVIPE